MVLKSWRLTASSIFLIAFSSGPTTAQTRQDLPTSVPNLSAYDSQTRQSMELACISDKTNGPVAYGACLNRQIASLQGSTGIPNLSGYDSQTRQSMELACISDKTNGPAAYGACLNRQIASLQGSIGIPNQSRYDSETRQTALPTSRSGGANSDNSRSGTQQSADWRYVLENEDKVQFFSAGNIQQAQDGHLEVWIKALTVKQLKAAAEKVAKDKDRVARIVQAQTSSPPPVSQVLKLNPDDLMGVATLEDIANNSPEVQPVTRILFEIDCAGHVMRMLSFWERENGKTKSNELTSEWMHVAPDTAGSMLLAVVCRNNVTGAQGR